MENQVKIGTRKKKTNSKELEGENVPHSKEDEVLGKKIMACAREGDTKQLSKILKGSVGNAINYQASNGCTALHYASVNGHDECVQILASYKAAHVPNKSGNTPLQWATQCKQHGIVKLLLKEYKDIDVLSKNAFGQGAVTHAFLSGNVDTISAMLTHHSATEERLLDAKQRKQLESLREATHEFCFDDAMGLKENNQTVRIREKAIIESKIEEILADTNSAQDDKTGLSIWSASVLLGRWIYKNRHSFKDKRVVELGAGCGLPGLCAAVFTDCKRVTLTDVHQNTMDNLKHNVSLNEKAIGTTKVEMRKLDWAKPDTWEGHVQAYDILIGSDLVYDKDVVPIFLNILKSLLRPSGTFFYTTAVDRAGRGELAKALVKNGFKMIAVKNCPADYRRNPLIGKSEKECDLILVDLKDTPFQLWQFQRSDAK